MTKTELWWTCNRCGYQVIIEEGEEFNDFTGEECSFCRDGRYGECEVYRNGVKIGSFNKEVKE